MMDPRDEIEFFHKIMFQIGFAILVFVTLAYLGFLK